ncbi:uncharacterized protein LOC126687880 [Mercurialis annua]|uniref:uncharacterized protein LOC126687880 n=1 Tax=Mercurialis annua TaxID=3986 RepID=UPI0024ACE9BD|nr:uncharacterized protein LOC126687880 [Mercurialis annua]
MISKEAEALIHLNEDVIPAASAFSNAENTCKGIRGKLKPKFSLHFKSHKNGLVQPYTYMDENVMLPSPCDMPEQLEPNEDGTLEDMNFEFLEGVDEENNEKLAILPAEVEAFGNGLIKHSMAELLFGLQDGNVVLKENSKMPRRTRGKKAQLIVKKSISSLGERIIDNEEQPEPVYSGSSGDDEADHHGLSLANLVMKKQTMADQFQEALAATSFSNEEVHVTTAKLSGIGLFGKLQQVMQSEKEKDADFLSRIQMGRRPDDESCSIVVKILSRYLDANLIVCHCSFGENVEGFHLPDNAQTLSDRGKEGTVIFSPKVCSNVDLEVGNFICIHPTWKEIQVLGNDETIILSTYFSHI